MKKILIFLALLTSFAASAQTFTVQQLVDSALLNQASVKRARLGVEAAQQQQKELFTKFFPTVSATGLWFNANQGMAKMEIDPKAMIPEQLQQTMAQFAQMLPAEVMGTLGALGNPISLSMMKNGTIGSVMAVQPVFAGCMIINGNKLARVGSEASELQLRMSENEVEKKVEQYFWQLASLQEKMKTIAVVEEMLANICKDVKVAVQAGVTMRNDLLQVQLRQNEVESQKVKLQNGIALVRMMLAQYCGLADDQFQIAYDTTESILMAQRRDHQQALANTPEYQLLEKQVEAAQLQKKMAIGQNLPTVAVGAGYTYHNLLDRDHTFGMIFASVSVPISGWWGGSHAIKRKNIELLQAKEQLDDNAQLLKIRMQKSWNDVEEAYQQLDIAKRSIEQAEENLRLNRNFYQAGTCTMSDLLQAQLLYQQASDQYTDAFAEYHNKVIEYRQAVGE